MRIIKRARGGIESAHILPVGAVVQRDLNSSANRQTVDIYIAAPSLGPRIRFSECKH
jgi:hypothetical protein